MLGLGLSLLTGGALRPYYAVVAAAFKDRVEADGGTVESMSCLKADLKVLNPIKPPAFTGLLNDYSGAAAAYSLRLLDNTYTGDAIVVRRASDNTTQNIGFVNNELDTASLESFCSGTDGFVTTWYDQSGNANNATQATASSQPKIVSSGSTILENGKAVVQFDGINDNIKNTAFSLDETINLSNAIVAKFNSILATQYIYASRKVSTNRSAIGIGAANGILSYQKRTDVIRTKSISVDSSQKLIFTENITPELYLNSSSSTGSDGIYNSGSDNSLYIGSNSNNTQYLNANIQELIFWQIDQSSNQSGIQTNINSHYNIYP